MVPACSAFPLQRELPRRRLRQSWPEFSRFANCDGASLQIARSATTAIHISSELAMRQPDLVPVRLAWRLLGGPQRRDWGIAYLAEFSGEAIWVDRFPICLGRPLIAALRR